MRTISEMYRRSGGTCWMHKCSECINYGKVKKQEICNMHPEKAPWKGTFVACKFFQDKDNKKIESVNRVKKTSKTVKTLNSTANEIIGEQLSIFDFVV